MVSIHAPVKERQGVQSHTNLALTVSIHAPVKERPNTSIQVSDTYLCFNPRSREGATDWNRYNEQKERVSIHAPVKERRFYFVKHLNSGRVSIHAPVKERRACSTAKLPPTCVSIHAPVKERRDLKQLRSEVESGFNPRSREGATVDAIELYCRGILFQSTLP